MTWLDLLVSHAVAIGFGCLIGGAAAGVKVRQRQALRRETAFAISPVIEDGEKVWQAPDHRAGDLPFAEARR